MQRSHHASPPAAGVPRLFSARNAAFLFISRRFHGSGNAARHFARAIHPGPHAGFTVLGYLCRQRTPADRPPQQQTRGPAMSIFSITDVTHAERPLQLFCEDWYS